MFEHIKAVLTATLTGVTLLSASPSSAQEKSGLYLNFYGGSSLLRSTTFSESRPAGGPIDGTADFGSGLGLGGAVGHRYGNGWAAELAWDYRSHDLDKVGGTPVKGEFASTVLFLNGYYRFQKVGVVRPLLGAGVGYVTEMDMDITRNGATHQYSRRGGLALQALVGGEVDLSDHWSLSADLRVSRMASGSFDATSAGTALGGKPGYRPVSINLGVTYRF